MKTNKFFATAFAVLALVGFTACDQPTPTEPLELTESSITLKVGETHQLTANVLLSLGLLPTQLLLPLLTVLLPQFLLVMLSFLLLLQVLPKLALFL